MATKKDELNDSFDELNGLLKKHSDILLPKLPNIKADIVDLSTVVHSPVSDVQAEFANRFKTIGKTVVAGGAVRDTLLGIRPKDYDIFILQDYKEWSFEQAKKAVEPFLTDLPNLQSEFEWQSSKHFLIYNTEWKSYNVQIMVTPARTVEELLLSFDWNVCMFAYDGIRLIQKEEIRNVGRGKTLKLYDVAYPISTLRRGFKFSEKFNMHITYGDISRLCKLVYETHNL